MKKFTLFVLFSYLFLSSCVSPSKLFQLGHVDQKGRERTGYMSVDGAPVFGTKNVFQTIRLSIQAQDQDTTYPYPVLQLWEADGVEFTTVLGKEVSVLRRLKIEDSVSKRKYDFCEISTECYPGKKLYVDRRFVTFEKVTAPRFTDTLMRDQGMSYIFAAEDLKNLPPSMAREVVIDRLNKAVGKPYCWGGNSSTSFSFAEYYQDLKGLLYGYDCSGLYDWALQTSIRHNSLDWITQGETVPIHDIDVSKESIIRAMELNGDGLYMIIFKLHVIGFVKNGDVIYSIESTWNDKLTGKRGVIKLDASQRLDHLLNTEKREFTNSIDEVSKEKFVLLRII